MKSRNANIELLRILSMFMVLVLHALGWSGALKYTSGIHFWIYWWIEALAIVAVNVFMIISGYFQINARFKTQSVLKILGGGVWSYAVIFSLLNCWLAGSKPSLTELARMIMPITMKKFWFVNSYLAVYILSPFINRTIHSITRKQLNALTGILVALFSLRVTILPITWAQDSTGGMGILWLGTLYVVGAWLRLTAWKLTRNVLHAVIYTLISFVLVGSKGILLRIGIPESYTGKLYGYPSVFVLMESVMLFLFFCNLPEIPEKAGKWICAVSKHSFSVYIIHFAMVGTLFTTVAGLDKVNDRPTVFIPTMILFCIVVFAACVLVDLGKTKLFSFIRIPHELKRITEKIDGILNGC